MKAFEPEEHMIFNGIIGSRLYGTNREDSDYDYRGVCQPTLEVLLDPFNGFEQKDSGFEEDDRVIYALDKFLKLCADNNPNILEMLFIPESHTLLKTKEWELISENKHLFLSKKAKHTFLGYSWQQLNKAKVHREWFLNPPKEKPTRQGYGLTDSPIISGEGLQAASNIKFELFTESFRDEIKREIEYRDAKKKWDNYVSWRDNRNPKRRELEAKYGYDTKSILHVFRLLEEGRQLLLNEKIDFPLHNSEELLEILNGKYQYEEAVEKAENMQKNFDLWYDESKLQHSANKKKLTEVYFNIILGK
jgi:hypothetical protein